MKNTCLAALWISARLLAGSVGRWFPWPNLAGLGLFALFAALIHRTPIKPVFKGR